MALQKRLNYGFNGYEAPPMPRAARSVRKRSVFKRKPDDRNMCAAFDLLATVAGKLPSTNTSPAKKDASIEDDNPFVEKSREWNFLVTELVRKAPDTKELVSAPVSVVTSSDCSEKLGSSEQLVNDDCKLSLGIFPAADNGVDSSSFNKVSRGSVPSRRDDVKLGNSDDDENSSECAGKNDFKRIRSQRDYPFKKRKLYSSSSTSNFNEGVGCRQHEIDASEGALGSSSSGVKLKIKSFRVPELLIEIPETATVGSLKRMVLEAVGSLLGGELHVGVLLQGKRIRDDNKTLLQTGISRESNTIDALGFTLEPSPPTAALIQSNCPDKALIEHPKPLARYLEAPSTSRSTLQQPDTRLDLNLYNSTGTFHDWPLSQKIGSESKALVPVMKHASLRKSKRSESAQRRIRRPFTVAEVEALVQAVEKLGTGRWRDVKLRAFDSAKHRTYVDLKDKWKTLVHTARISPQQRRGEPVPQELLDRVLMAHAYWSQQQQLRSTNPDACRLLL
ncbi:telomere repeat-binding protein 5 [Andrographis paniculata]|uniref:telomere repeat-binding protein 5 n=1 Tax=Andrographis paniculata TaxID=175694 RepID=UPI0021E8EC13|nr:telomere repeat-binding protein 5 [Andrographis paniculata]